MSAEVSSALDKESLFSLEIVVDSVSIGDVVCRFPAVAFKLLDFPTLIMHHVEPDLAKGIKQKIIISSHSKLPKQFKELQNKDGGYTVKKGKSCLFKAPPNTLHTMLQSTPLYVMLMDTYPDTPCLVANCTVPLNTLIDDVLRDIREMGVSVPNVHGNQDTFKIFNLMSQPIGSISVKYRVLSLGMSLMPHIPRESVAELQPHTMPTPDIVLPPPEAFEEPLRDVPSLSSADKNIQSAICFPLAEMSCQTEQRHSGTTATQTEHMNSKPRQKTKKQNFFKEHEDDFLFENVLRPLPLFFNSNAREKTAWPSELDPKERVNDNFEHCTDSDDDTIRVEDLESEREISQITKEIVEDSLYEPKAKKHPQVKALKLSMQPDQIVSAINLPILSALVEEILQLKTGKISSDLQISQPKACNIPPGKGKAMHEKVLSPKQKPKQERIPSSIASKKCHSVCASGLSEVPKNKSWVRQAPSMQSYGTKKTNIIPGLTNTQRLRLAKNNPQLLVTLEQQEKERIEKRKAQLPKQSTKEPAVRAQHPMAIDVSAGEEEASALKRPVPTPRQSITKMSIDNSEPYSQSFRVQSPGFKEVYMTAEKPEQQPQEGHTQKPEQQPWEGLTHKPEQQPWEGLTHKPEQQPREGLTQKPEQQPWEGLTHKPEQQPREGLTHKPEQQPWEGLTHKPEQQPREGLTQKPEQQPREGLMQTHTIIPRPQISSSDTSESYHSTSEKNNSDSDALFMSSLDLRRVTESYYDDLDSQASSQAKITSSAVMQSKTPQPETSVTSDYLPEVSKSLWKFPRTSAESISSYVPTEDDRPLNQSAGADYSDEFDDLSEEFQIPRAKTMKELEIDPLAKIGSTWHA